MAPHACFLWLVFLVSILQTHKACKKQKQFPHTHANVNIDTERVHAGRCIHAVRHRVKGLASVFSFPCVVGVKLRSVLLRPYVTGLSLTPSLCLCHSTYLSFVFSFHYRSPVFPFILPLPSNPFPLSLSTALFFHFVCLLSSPQHCSKNPSI